MIDSSGDATFWCLEAGDNSYASGGSYFTDTSCGKNHSKFRFLFFMTDEWVNVCSRDFYSPFLSLASRTTRSYSGLFSPFGVRHITRRKSEHRRRITGSPEKQKDYFSFLSTDEPNLLSVLYALSTYYSSPLLESLLSS